jgi:solute carrier family 27 (fatty acid transporter), member 1/4
MKEKLMKTKLTTSEKVLTLAGITLAGTLLSSLIGRHFIPQALLTSLVLYLISGRRPSIVYATCHTIRRDLL